MLPSGCGPRAALVRRHGTAGLSRSLWESAGGGFGGAWCMGLVALLPGRCGPLRGRGWAPLAWQAGYRADVSLVGLQHPAGWRGGEVGEGGGAPGFPCGPPPVCWFVSPAAAGGWLEGPCLDPPCGRLCGAARPPLQRALPGLFGIPWRRSRPGGLAAGGSFWPSRPPMCREGGGRGGRSVCCPPRGRGSGAPGGRGEGGRSASVRPPASLGRATKRVSWASLSSWRGLFPCFSGSCLRAAARMRSAGCPCAPVQDYRTVVVTGGPGG